MNQMKKFKVQLRRYLPGIISRVSVIVEAYNDIEAIHAAESFMGSRFEALWTEVVD